MKKRLPMDEAMTALIKPKRGMPYLYENSLKNPEMWTPEVRGE